MFLGDKIIPDTLAFRHAKEGFARIGDEFSSLVRHRPEGWKRDYVTLRRTFQDAVTEIGANGRRLLSQRGDVTLLQRFEEAHARFRHLSMLHHVDWPVIKIDEENPDYIRSLDQLTAAYVDFAKLLGEIAR